ncbi:hypothetical protein [Colwellia psychrerythraea]|uniref:Uncharacterized protein n=1 Tax=Colwellia psychrerythraea TaxID=28229 RepID=A0A099KN30_COLPS|nr:hypothetical protein [Colwellia psychrerythraea]KGJ92144.1 hypothetical protein ND2E_3037 [Colwellia psychrerythraea]
MKTLIDLIAQLPEAQFIELRMALQLREEFIWEKLADDEEINRSHFRQCKCQLAKLNQTLGMN